MLYNVIFKDNIDIDVQCQLKYVLVALCASNFQPPHLPVWIHRIS
jgi:hypothetical protein